MKIKEYIIQIIKEELTSDEFVTDKYINDDILGSDEGERMFNEYLFDNNMEYPADYDEFMEDKNNEEDFKKWLEYEMKFRFEEKQDEFDRLFSQGGGKITLYRAMKVTKSWVKSLTKPNAKLGIYWSYEEDAAEPHWGYGGKTSEDVLLQTSVTKDQVDWEGTYYANLSPSTGEEEKEMRLKEGVKIRLEGLWLNNNEINLNKKIKSNIYLA